MPALGARRAVKHVLVVSALSGFMICEEDLLKSPFSDSSAAQGIRIEARFGVDAAKRQTASRLRHALHFARQLREERELLCARCGKIKAGLSGYCFGCLPAALKELEEELSA